MHKQIVYKCSNKTTGGYAYVFALLKLGYRVGFAWHCGLCKVGVQKGAGGAGGTACRKGALMQILCYGVFKGGNCYYYTASLARALDFGARLPTKRGGGPVTIRALLPSGEWQLQFYHAV